MRRLWLVGVVTCVLAARVSAAAQDAEPRPASVAFDGPDGAALLDISLSDFVTGSDERLARMRSGLPQMLAVRVGAIDDATSEVLASATRTCEIRYDGWLRSYSVVIRPTPSAPAAAESPAWAPGVDEAIDACLVLEDFAVGDASSLGRATSSLHFSVVVELNAADSVTIHQLRQWLGRPDGASGGGETFFGLVASLFLSRASLRLSVLDEHGATDGRLEVTTGSYPAPP